MVIIIVKILGGGEGSSALHFKIRSIWKEGEERVVKGFLLVVSMIRLAEVD